MKRSLKSTAETMKARNLFELHEEGVRYKPWKGRLRILLVYPHTYYVGMSNLGMHSLYGLWNDIDEVVLERGFLSDQGGEILSIESRRPARDFDVVAFSLSFENDAIHILRALKQMGLALRSSDRSDQDPLVMVGGAAVSMNPGPIMPFMDLFVFGDGEEVLAELTQVLRRSPFLRHHKTRLLEDMVAQVPGTYSPVVEGFHPGRMIKRRTLKFLNSFQTKTEIVTNNTEFSQLFLVEVSRGCPQRCRFCSVSYTEASTRFRRLSFLQAAFDEGIERVGRVGLLGAALSDHPELVEMADYIVGRGGEISLSSLRIEAVGPKLMELLVYSKQRTLTLALETGSQRLQEIIHKRTKLETLTSVVETALKAGVRNFKFYFIIGLPTETRNDIEELAALVKEAHRIFFAMSRSLGRIGTMTVSLNPFIPKPTTPFESCAHVRVDELQARFDLLMERVKDLPHLQINHEGWDTAILQSLLSVGGEEVADFLEATHQGGDNWRAQLPRFQELIEKTVFRPKGLGEVLPWSFITK